MQIYFYNAAQESRYNRVRNAQNNKSYEPSYKIATSNFIAKNEKQVKTRDFKQPIWIFMENKVTMMIERTIE